VSALDTAWPRAAVFIFKPGFRNAARGRHGAKREHEKNGGFLLFKEKPTIVRNIVRKEDIRGRKVFGRMLLSPRAASCFTKKGDQGHWAELSG